jgi:hypothetical protein
MSTHTGARAAPSAYTHYPRHGSRTKAIGTQALVERAVLPFLVLTAPARAAEQVVLAANSNGSRLRTCAIRSAGIYGEGEQRHYPRIGELTASRSSVAHVSPFVSGRGQFA